jgi:hypothetical protein
MTQTIDYDALGEFSKLKFGWVFPDGKLVACRLYDHYEVLGAKYKDRYRELVDDYQRSMNDQLDQEQEEAGDGYYHPAMHRFDPEGDAQHDVIHELYRDGYLRVGTGKSGKNIFLEFEGTRAAFDRNRELAKAMFELLDYSECFLAIPSPDHWVKTKRETIFSKR